MQATHQGARPDAAHDADGVQRGASVRYSTRVVLASTARPGRHDGQGQPLLIARQANHQ
jgi:hypothetical protein